MQEYNMCLFRFMIHNDPGDGDEEIHVNVSQTGDATHSHETNSRQCKRTVGEKGVLGAMVLGPSETYHSRLGNLTQQEVDCRKCLVALVQSS